MVVMISFIYIIVIFLEVIPLSKNSPKKETIIYLIMMTVSLLMSILIVIGIKIPSPAKFIENIVKVIIG